MRWQRTLCWLTPSIAFPLTVFFKKDLVVRVRWEVLYSEVSGFMPFCAGFLFTIYCLLDTSNRGFFVQLREDGSKHYSFIRNELWHCVGLAIIMTVLSFVINVFGIFPHAASSADIGFIVFIFWNWLLCFTLVKVGNVLLLFNVVKDDA